MAQIIFEIEDEVYNIAKEWFDIQESIIPLEEYKKLPFDEREPYLKKISEEMRKFFVKHKDFFKTKYKTTQILGVKESYYAPDKEIYQKFIDVVGLLQRKKTISIRHLD